MNKRTPGIAMLSQDWFQINLTVWQSAHALYATDLLNGVAASEEEFRRCFALAQELLGNDPQKRAA